MPNEKKLRTADEIIQTQSLMDDLLAALFFEQDSPGGRKQRLKRSCGRY
ncbi:MAG: hypothetical protein HDQ87_00795 [Clostridia bacterium]|nr:hypothetical protein [Clostridia bacterium]